MKTKEQILEWLDKQPWRDVFYKAYFMYNTRDIRYDEKFIESAFIWNFTGFAKNWAERSQEYKKWYNSPNKPMSWEEYCKQNPVKSTECFIDGECNFERVPSRERVFWRDANVMSPELCRAFLAYMKLIQLRNAWVKDCVDVDMCYQVTVGNNSPYVKECKYNANGLSFPFAMLANEFINTFKDLLETAKPLL